MSNTMNSNEINENKTETETQLSIFYDEANSAVPNNERESVPEKSIEYEALDQQLATLMQTLNGEKSETLKQCVLDISQHTREGQIALECSSVQQSELQNSKIVGNAGDYQPLILDGGYLYLRRYWQYQYRLAEQIKSRLKTAEPDTEFETWAQQRLDFYFGKESGKESGKENSNTDKDWQKVAAGRALKNQFLIVSGGPGTGKTTTITRLLALLIEVHISAHFSTNDAYQKATPPVLASSNPLKILLAAPTGKASIRMLDAINKAQATLNAPDEVLAQMPKQASTIHKLLGLTPEKVGFKHNCNNPLNADVVLIDEASMIDIALMSKLVEAVLPHAKLILIGDKNQLSSVETGSVFADMCEGLASTNSLVTLQKNWRFSKDSSIGQLEIAAHQGDSKSLLAVLKDETKPDGTLIDPSVLAKNNIPKMLIEPWKNYFNVLNNPDAHIADIFDAFNQYRILCALRRGLNGSEILSQRIETALEKQGDIIRSKQGQTQSWYHGRPIMITRNSYSKGLFNGDTGIALMDKTEGGKGEIKVYFPDARNSSTGEVEQNAFKAIAPVRLPAHETTWAMTIHKSQGSEFNQVALILPHEVMPLLTKQLIYTGITRAKQQMSIIANEAVLKAGIKTNVVKATQIENLLD